MKCENCKIDHDGSYGSGRFCSCKCARGFSTKERREEINEKVSKTLRKDKSLKELTKQQVVQRRLAAKHASYERENEITTLLDLSSRTVSKILRRMHLKCSRCGWDEDIGDLHHIIERKNGGTDNHINLSYICPNCHRLYHSGKIDRNELINLQDYIGGDWKKYYYVKNRKIIEITNS